MKVVDEMLKNKNIEIKKNEQHCMSLIKIIEEQKKNISNLNNRLNNIYQNDIESSKKTIFEKDQEIQFLKNFSNSLKSQITSMFYLLQNMRKKSNHSKLKTKTLEQKMKS